MTDNTRALLEQALASLQGYRRELNDGQPCDTEKAIVAELAKPVEPVTAVAWLDDFGNVFPIGARKGAESWIESWIAANQRNWKPIYLHPPTPAWHDAPEVAALKSEIERLRKDAERLDYIEESGNFGVTRYRSGPGGPVLIEAEDGKKDISKSASSLRDAIDSVIKEVKGTL